MDSTFDALVSHLMAKGFSSDEARYQVEQWTGLKPGARKVPLFLSTGEFPEEHGRGQFG